MLGTFGLFRRRSYLAKTFCLAYTPSTVQSYMNRLSLAPFVLFALASTTNVSAEAKAVLHGHAPAVTKYSLSYQRWGDFGSYHLGIKITKSIAGEANTTWFINGGWDTTFAHDTLLVYQIPALFPVFLRAYIHPTHPTSPLFNIRRWEDFEQAQEISAQTAMRLVAYAHNGMSNINSGRLMYSPIVRPFQLGVFSFWTSNSFVASILHWLNEGGSKVALPKGGNYPGLEGPFLSQSIFELHTIEQH